MLSYGHPFATQKNKTTPAPKADKGALASSRSSVPNNLRLAPPYAGKIDRTPITSIGLDTDWVYNAAQKKPKKRSTTASSSAIKTNAPHAPKRRVKGDAFNPIPLGPNKIVKPIHARFAPIQYQPNTPFHFSESPTPHEHLAFLHGTSKEANVGIRRFDENAQAKLREANALIVSKSNTVVLNQHINTLRGEPSVYITQANFFWGEYFDKDRHRCTMRYLREINCVYVDLDYYNNPDIANEPADKVGMKVISKCLVAGLPAPLLIYSGRGLYAIWPLDEPFALKNNPQAIERWKNVQNRFMDALEEFGPDPKAMDLTRILRLVGSVNAKTGHVVSILHDNGRRHPFAALEKQSARFNLYTERLKAQKNAIKAALCQVNGELDQQRAECIDQQDGNSAHANGHVNEHKNEHEKSSRDTKTKRHNMSQTKVSQTKVSASNLQPGEIWRAPQSALDDLKALIEKERKMANALGSWRKHQYILFRDIANLIIARGGIACGMRDEVIFWMLVSRANAGILSHQDLPFWSAMFSRIAQDELDVYATGALSTLENRLQGLEEARKEYKESKKEQAKNKLNQPAPICAQKPMSTGVGVAAKPKRRTFNPKYYTLYTPSINTLITRLSITPDEQRTLERLTSQDERARRRDESSGRTARWERDNAIWSAYLGGESATAIAKYFEISRATAYRVIRELKTLHNVTCDSKSAHVLEVYSQSPTSCVREIARRAKVSTTHAWRTIQSMKSSRGQSAAQQAPQQTPKLCPSTALIGSGIRPSNVNTTAAPSYSAINKADKASDAFFVPFFSQNEDSISGGGVKSCEFMSGGFLGQKNSDRETVREGLIARESANHFKVSASSDYPSNQSHGIDMRSKGVLNASNRRDMALHPRNESTPCESNRTDCWGVDGMPIESEGILNGMERGIESNGMGERSDGGERSEVNHSAQAAVLLLDPWVEYAQTAKTLDDDNPFDLSVPQQVKSSGECPF